MTALQRIVTAWIETGDRPPRHWWTRGVYFHWTNLVVYGGLFALIISAILISL